MDYKIGDKVDLLVVRETELGYIVLINEEDEGLLYKNEVYSIVLEGAKLEGYIKKIREDEKIDVSLQPIGFRNTININEEKVLDFLNDNNGYLPLHDKSSPLEIKNALNMSKKAFKNAIGGLYKKKIILIDENGIRLAVN